MKNRLGTNSKDRKKCEKNLHKEPKNQARTKLQNKLKSKAK